MPGVEKAKKGKKQRKFGRSAKYCQYYAATHRREQNKLKRLKKHLFRFVADKCAIAAYNSCKVTLGIRT